ncbi:MAG: hypothetical protein FJ028_02060 [Chloroflexi bacterium]|nr:hypothetical protein [Chloroflexota bacterium]
MRTTSTGGAHGAVALGLLALAALAGGTKASFTATTVNPNDLLATATLALSNDKPNDGALVSVSNLVPGDTATRTVTIANTGTAGFTYAADDSFQGLSQTFAVTHAATQLAGTAR